MVAPLILLLAVLTGVESRVRAPTFDAPAPGIGGVCLSCPSFDFGPFTPTPAYQTHSNSLSGGSDCAWYRFNVVAGNRYEFSTCPPGSTLGDWNSVIELYDPATSCVASVARADGGCGNPSLLAWDATLTGVVHVKVKPATTGTAPGQYTLAYRSLGIVCEDCLSPGPMIVPAACACVSGLTTPACPSDFYLLSLQGGITYEFTTCPESCPAAGAGFDTSLRIRDQVCTILTGSDDSCATFGLETRSTLTFIPTVTGLHVLEVTGSTAGGGSPATGTYTLCTSITCGLSPLTIAPASGSADPTSCSRTVDFGLAVGASAGLPVTYSWTVTPPPRGAAVPSRGTVTSGAPSGAATFRTRLSGRGTHVVSVMARNSCGSIPGSVPFDLRDATPPFVLAPPGRIVECPAVPPPDQPRVRDNCDPAPDVVLTEVTTPGPCPSAYVVRRTWIATDDAGNASSPARQVVSVTDRTAPVVTPDTTVAHCVYPPDHGRACFTFADFTPLASDACPGPISWIFARVTHDEEALGACDPPDESPDVEIAADGSGFCVRAERCVDDPGVADGRSYLVEAVATDACGNSSPLTAIATILVPQDGTDTTSCRVPVPW